MYLPSAYKEDRLEVLHALMRARPLAVVISQAESGLTADHLPLELFTDVSGSVLRGHVARANPLWREHLPGTEAMAIFQGPHVYVSPSLYATKLEGGEVVPTWDYAVVHARGSLTFTHEAQWLKDLVSRLTDTHEGSRAQPWKVGDAPALYIEKMLGAIVGFELTIASLSGKWKVSQNRSAADQHSVIAGLQAAPDEDSRQIAGMLAERAPR